MAYWVNPICPPDSVLCLAGGVAVGDLSATVGTPQGLGTLGAAAADSEVSLFLLLIFILIGLDAAGVLRTLRLEHGTGDLASGGAVAELFVSLSFVVVEFMLRSFG